MRTFVTQFQPLLTRLRTHTATDSVGIAQAVKPARIQFIDVLRAFAILMMLQGHFVDTTLAEQFRNPDHPVYSAWYFMRGLTAPIFFTTTGLVFVFLLLKDGRPLGENVRVRKGIRRGVMLLFWGYFLKINLFAVLSGRLYGWYFTVDVLHCIGIALLILIGVFALSQKIRMPFWILLSLLSFFAFFIDPSFKAADWSALPQPIANLFTLDYGSVFTPVPWVGYTLFGGLMGYVLHVRPKLAFTHLFPLALLVTGYLVSHYSSMALIKLHQLSGWENFKSLAYNNGLFWRLGHVFIVQGIFMWGIARLRVVPRIWTKVGSETLTIYCVHYVLLFGTWFGLGIAGFWARSLSPWVCALGAASFVAAFVVLIAYIEPIREWLYRTLPARARYRWRVARVVVLRSVSRRLHARQRLKTLSLVRSFLF